MNSKTDVIYKKELKKRYFHLDEDGQKWYKHAIFALKNTSPAELNMSTEDFILAFEKESNNVTLFSIVMLCNAVEKLSFKESGLETENEYLWLLNMNVTISSFWQIASDVIFQKIEDAANPQTKTPKNEQQQHCASTDGSATTI